MSMEQMIEHERAPLREKKYEEMAKRVESVFNYYDSLYKNHEWSTCCNGRDCACLGKPIDPEYYIYNDLKEAMFLISEIRNIK